MRILIALFLALLLVGCGGSREDKAVAACERALAEKAGDKAFEADLKAMRTSAQAEGADQIVIKSSVTFDPGLPREQKQDFECTARFTEGKAEPDVISFSLIW